MYVIMCGNIHTHAHTCIHCYKYHTHTQTQIVTFQWLHSDNFIYSSLNSSLLGCRIAAAYWWHWQLFWNATFNPHLQDHQWTLSSLIRWKALMFIQKKIQRSASWSFLIRLLHDVATLSYDFAISSIIQWRGPPFLFSHYSESTTLTLTYR